VDLGRVRNIDTQGLCLLVGSHRQFAAEGRELILVNALHGVRRAMDLTGVSALLSLVE
jgi:anti-anti-sigma factor